jgi:hypothetical protein
LHPSSSRDRYGPDALTSELIPHCGIAVALR